jgi:hypothetical protein
LRVEVVVFTRDVVVVATVDVSPETVEDVEVEVLVAVLVSGSLLRISATAMSIADSAAAPASCQLAVRAAMSLRLVTLRIRDPAITESPAMALTAATSVPPRVAAGGRIPEEWLLHLNIDFVPKTYDG